MDKQTLGARLDALAAEINAAQDRLKLKNMLHKEKHTTDEMLTRYKVLKGQLGKEIMDLEEHGHHVGLLERTFRKWVDSIDLDT